MRHGKSKARLPGPASKANADLCNLAVGLLTHGRIETTVKRAKVLRPFVEKMVTQGQKCCSTADSAREDALYRSVLARLRNNKVAAELTTRIWGPYFSGRNGGYTRILRTGYRAGDCAELAIIEFVRDGTEWGCLDVAVEDFSTIVQRVEDHLPVGRKYLAAWRRIPRPIVCLLGDTGINANGRLKFKLDISLPASEHLIRLWPIWYGDVTAMPITVFVTTSSDKEKYGVAITLRNADREVNTASRSDSVNLRISPSSGRQSVECEIWFDPSKDVPPYCILVVETPIGEIFHAALI